MDDKVGDEGVVVAHNEEEEKEDGLPEAEDREKDMPEEDCLRMTDVPEEGADGGRA